MAQHNFWYIPIPADDLIAGAKEFAEHTRSKTWGTTGEARTAEIIVAKAKPSGLLKRVESRPSAAVYVLIHGMTFRPDLSAGGKTISVEKLADQIRDELLPKAHADLRLFACYSGMSTRNDQPEKTLAEKEEINKYLKDHSGVGQRVQVKNYLALKGFKDPENYGDGSNTGPTQPGTGRPKFHQEVPTAGQLCSYLKSRGYYKLVVTGYQGAITLGVSNGGSSAPNAPVHKWIGVDRASATKMRFTGEFDGRQQRWV